MVSPSAEGLVTRADNLEDWVDHITPVLLSILSSLKSNSYCSAAELVFSATVRLSGEVSSPTPRDTVEDPTNLLHRLRQVMLTFSLVPPRPFVSESYLKKNPSTCSYVHPRWDRARRPLGPPCDGPFRVISRGTKTFRVQHGAGVWPPNILTLPLCPLYASHVVDAMCIFLAV
nr:unnamed protein product [Spirometra erinaceieuropaei]